MKKITLLLISLILFVVVLKSQNPKWINYLNKNAIQALAEDANYVWAGTSNGLLKLNKSSGITSFYNSANAPIYSDDIRCVVSIIKYQTSNIQQSNIKHYISSHESEYSVFPRITLTVFA